MHQKPYDYLIVGSGLFGSVFAYKMHQAGKKCLIIEKRNHPGGNVHNQTIDGIITHQYGAHIFHTNDEKIWQFVNQFATFRPYRHQVKVSINEKLYSFPINLKTLLEWYQTDDETLALKTFNSQISPKRQYQNLEEMALAELGEDLYKHFIKGYTEKQWNKPCNALPISIFKRLPLRQDHNEFYFDDKFQGIPEGGYNVIIDQLLNGIDLKLNTDFFENKSHWENQAETIVYTGCIDQLFDYQFGKLDYRSLRFENETIAAKEFQPYSVINYPSADIAYTRIIEHKHFHPSNLPHTVITKEFPQDYNSNNEPYYPIIDNENKKRYAEYLGMAKEQNYILGGRLAEFKYYDMHQVIASALNQAEQILQKP
ncbi:MAG: UDP-galactopyranose mutase [Bacteroidota bacterium]|nr:UDP-galactopyranose mutase [Bacteroidota bacterium]